MSAAEDFSRRKPMATIELYPIGFVRGGRADAVDDNWGDSEAVIELVREDFDAMALAGLADFSHAEVIFRFDRVAPEKIERGARHPRNRNDWPLVGIFAQRGKNRPNRLGLTTCEILAVDGTRLHVRGLDAIDGTPVLDIKPAMREYQPRGEIRQPDWAGELMADYW
jgi:tRNA-Thr(GGU) m(6)t(6)A37 methyltransferase TsaA